MRDELAEKILNHFRDGYRKARGSKEYFAGGERISESIKRGGDRYWSGYSRSESHSDGSGRTLGDAESNIKEPTDKELRDEVRGELNAQREEKALRSAEAAAERAHKASVRLSWNDEKKNLLLTAFEKKEASASIGKTTDTDDNPLDSQGDTALLQNTDALSKNKNTTSDATHLHY